MTMKRFKVIVMPRADRDLEEIQEYLSQFFRSTPKKFMKEFRDAVDFISFSPWNVKLDCDTTYHRVYVRKYAVIYRVDEESNTVYIHRVIHGSRNFRRGVDIEVMEERAVYSPKP